MSAFRYALVVALAAALLLLNAIPALAGDGLRRAGTTNDPAAPAMSSTTASPTDPGEPRR